MRRSIFISKPDFGHGLFDVRAQIVALDLAQTGALLGRAVSAQGADHAVIVVGRGDAGDAGQHHLRPTTKAGAKMRDQSADRDLQITAHDFLVDKHRCAARGFTQVHQMFVGIVIVDTKTPDRLLAQLLDKILLGHGGMVGIGGHKADLVIRDAGLGQLLQHSGQDLRGRRRAGQIVEEDDDPCFALGHLAQGLCAHGLAQRLAHLRHR